MTKEILLSAGDLIDEKEAAAILAVATTTLRNWRALRQGPPFLKIGRRLVRYRRGDLAMFIANEGARA